MKSALMNIARGVRDNLRYTSRSMTTPAYSTAVDVRFFGDADHHTFMGYYDINVFDSKDKRMIAGRCPSSHNGRAMDTPLEIGYYDLGTNDFHKIGGTKAWSWQQGCRLQWVDWQDAGKELLLYNDLQGNTPGTVLYDSETNAEVKRFPFATYCYSPAANAIATLDFDYLERCRDGYGYDYKTDPSAFDTAITVFDVKTGKEKRVIDAARAHAFNPDETMQGAEHYFNHLHFNPSGTRLMVFHIWNKDGQRYLRALTMNLDGTDLADVTGGIKLSHYWWLNDDDILLFGTDPQHGEAFHIYNQAGHYLRTLDKNIPEGDGHPRAHPVLPDWFVSDSLVNRSFNRNLWLYNLKEERHVNLATFKSPPQFKGHNRCDLHPRFSSAGNLVAVDTAHDGHRQIAVLNVSEKLK